MNAKQLALTATATAAEAAMSHALLTEAADKAADTLWQVEVLTPRSNGATEQPHWFRPKAFLAPDFDADAFIADLRRYVRFPPRTAL